MLQCKQLHLAGCPRAESTRCCLLQAAFLHQFVRNQKARLKRTSRSAAWRHDAHTTKEQALRAETELQQLVHDLKAAGTVHAAFCQEWVEHERRSQVVLHDLKLQCSDKVAQVREGCTGATTEQLVREQMGYAQQMDQNVWDLAQEIRYTCRIHFDGPFLLGIVLILCIFLNDLRTCVNAGSSRMKLTVLIQRCPSGGLRCRRTCITTAQDRRLRLQAALVQASKSEAIDALPNMPVCHMGGALQRLVQVPGGKYLNTTTAATV